MIGGGAPEDDETVELTGPPAGQTGGSMFANFGYGNFRHSDVFVLLACLLCMSAVFCLVR